MRVRTPLDTAGVGGKTDLAATIARTWIIPLHGRRRVSILVKADATTGNGLASVALASRAHPDADFLTVTPALESAVATANDAGISATHYVAFSNTVLTTHGYVADVKSGLYAQDGTPFVTFPSYEGYPAMHLRIVATAGAAAATVTGVELVLFESADIQASGIG